MSMENNSFNKNSDPSLKQTLKNDLREVHFKRDFIREYKELKNFYLTEEKKARLESMGKFHRFFYQLFWLVKSLFLNLTPFRRILVIIGMVLLIGVGTVRIDNNDINGSSNNNGLLGGAIIIFVLMLELKDKLFAKEELEAGRKVQQALAPTSNQSIPGWSIWLNTKPANEVSGDLVDFLKIDDDKYGLIIADIAGKGLSAALLMAKLQSIIRAIVYDYESISKLCGKINEIFHRDSLPTLFASMIYIEINTKTNQLRYVNAGHLPPILIDAKQITEMPKGEAALGLIKRIDFSEKLIDLNDSDIFLAYSDGLTEAKNEHGDFFGIERLRKILPTLYGLSTERIGQTILEHVDYFVDDNVYYDDLSLLIIKRNNTTN